MTFSRRMLLSGASLGSLAGFGLFSAAAARAEDTGAVDWPEMLKAGS